MEKKCNCEKFLNCCDCGEDDCDCEYCWSCRACEGCINDVGLPNGDYWEVENEYGYGMLKVGDEDDKRNNIVYLSSLSIFSAFQNKGHGGRLLETILEDAFEFGYKKVMVHARPLLDDSRQKDLIRFYEKHGFKKSEDFISFQGVYMESDL